YQLVIEDIAPAGMGALMAMLEKRRQKLAAEGLFDAERKRPLPYLPEVIGVVTSPSGAVIRDILHRLRDRFPRKVLIWPVAVQGAACAPEVARAIEGFNRLLPGGWIPRPDVLIVARGGGSVEDLWGFNEEIVARAAAASEIPLISAVGHETDTTLIDFASDRRAPTPTAAAEMAVPVRSELVAQVQDDSARLIRAAGRLVADYKSHLQGLSRGLPDLNTLMANQRQRLDDWGERLGTSLQSGVHRRHRRLAEVAGALSSPRARIAYGFERLDSRGDGLLRAARRIGEARRRHLQQTARLLDGLSYERVLDRGFALVTDAKGKAVTDAKALAPGDDILVKMKG
ncbi:MAG TPA: exodeoxyribonuclease VII large subunit, partial [Paracoccaceae bacterium]|nr:exodeoxyribonuclease VII large subunit [Paracoccaceae bacterium]